MRKAFHSKDCEIFGALQREGKKIRNQAYLAQNGQAKNRYLWRYLYKHVHMIGTNFCFINLNSLPFTKLPKYLSDLHLLLSEENLSSILGCKDYVVFAIPFRVR